MNAPSVTPAKAGVAPLLAQRPPHSGPGLRRGDEVLSCAC
jgi:hypothetical protein